MSDEPAFEVVPISDKVRSALTKFFRSLGREVDEINDDTDLLKSTGAASDDGVDFALDLSEVLGVEVPDDFNPFVHPSGKRGMKFRELIEYCERFVAESKGGGHVS